MHALTQDGRLNLEVGANLVGSGLDGLLGGDIGLDVEDLVCASGGSSISRRGHVEHGDPSPVFVREQLDDAPANTRRATSDDDDLVLENGRVTCIVPEVLDVACCDFVEVEEDDKVVQPAKPGSVERGRLDVSEDLPEADRRERRGVEVRRGELALLHTLCVGKEGQKDDRGGLEERCVEETDDGVEREGGAVREHRPCARLAFPSDCVWSSHDFCEKQG